MQEEVLLQVENLKKYFPIKGGIFGRKTIGNVRAVDNVSFKVYKGETLGIVGESGCGKSTTGRCIIRLIKPTSGHVYFKGQDLTLVKEKKLRQVRRDFQIVFQDPFASLNPRMRVGEIIQEPLDNYNLYDTATRQKLVKEMIEKVGLPSNTATRFPHEFSGGQRQRIGLARAIILNPELIIADEPVSALDVSVQSQVLNLMRELQEEYQLTYIFISHDLSVVNHFCDRIAVMYLGSVVELSPTDKLYEEPLHPYTKSLLAAVPVPDPNMKKERIILEGDVPSPSNPPSGCPFHPRCPEAHDKCKTIKPELIEAGEGRKVACHLYEETGMSGQLS